MEIKKWLKKNEDTLLKVIVIIVLLTVIIVANYADYRYKKYIIKQAIKESK